MGRFRLTALSCLGAVLSGVAAPLAAQTVDGAEIYAENCARCHETALTLVPTREVLGTYTPEMIESALTGSSMRTEAAHLTHAERRAVAAHLAGVPAGEYKAPFDAIPESAICAESTNVADPLAGPAWNGWGTGLDNDRFQPAASAGLTAADVPRLKLKWAFGIPGVAMSGSQPTVVGGRVFLGTRNGMVYSLDAETGCVIWGFQADGGVRSTPVVVRDDGRGTVYFGDAHARVYALDALTGEPRWNVQVDDHVAATITGGTVYHEGRLYVPVSSFEEASAIVPTYECCTFRGSLVALDADTGETTWQTRTTARGPEPTGSNAVGTRTWGPSGAAIWSAPTLDPDNNRIYVATGDNYSNPPVATSDAIMALTLDTGEVRWVQQTLPNDAWNTSCLAGAGETFNCPDDEGPDYDYGSSPVLARRADGSEILLAGQKSGVLYGLDPTDGRLLWERRVGDGGVLGGIEWGFAADGRAAYVSISEAYEKAPGEAGGLAAITLDDGALLWEAPPPPADACANRTACNTAQPGAVTAIPGVVFSGSLDGHLRAYDAATGAVIWDYDTVRQFDTVNDVPAHGGALNGPGVTVVDGTVFASSGYASFGYMAGNVLLAFSTE